jgi:nonsense-mediated mRNA decay protein 3
MRKKFCPKCGKEVEKLYGKLCRDCFLGSIAELKIPSKIVVKECKDCGRIYFDDSYTDTVEESIDKILSKILEKPQIESASYRVEGDRIHVTLNLQYGDLKKSEERTILLLLKKITCKPCSMKNVGYHRSIIQLRVPERLMESIIEDIRGQVENLRKHDKLSFISKIDRKKEGTDIYLGSKSAASHIVKNIKNQFKAKIKVTAKQAGFVNGRKVYRDTILISIGE